MTELIEAVKASNWQTDGGEQRTTYWVTLLGDDAHTREVPCYDARGADLKTDTELPEGWEVKTSKAGKLYLAPPRTERQNVKGAFGKPAWANTEEGERFVQERMDRRTALMQADTTDPASNWLIAANAYYTWLRASLENVSAPPGAAPVRDGLRTGEETAGTGPRPAVGADTPSDGGGVVQGKGTPPSPPSHAEKWSPYGNPEKCSHQLVPGRPGWLKCTKCGSAKKEGEWA